MIGTIIAGIGAIGGLGGAASGFAHLGGNYDTVNRRFSFTMRNKSKYSFRLVDIHKWYGNLEAPSRELASGSSTHTRVLEIRGYKRPDNATGVTYTLCFTIHYANGADTGYRLHVYLQVGYNANNYYGWFIQRGGLGLKPQRWYDDTDFDHHKENCEDRVLNKGGTFSLNGRCAPLNLTIRMYTDNQSWSTPSMHIT